MDKTKKLEAEGVAEFQPKPLDLGIEAVEDPQEKIEVNLNNPKQKVPGLRLNIGSGVDYKEGFVNVDPFDDDADVKAFAQSLPFHDNSVAQIVCYQVLEHIPQLEVLPVLKEFHRVLKANGNLVLAVPDMVGSCERFLADPENDWSLARIYGTQAHEGQFHKSGFTPKRLFKYCGYAGFRTVGIAYFNEGNGVRNLYVDATK